MESVYQSLADRIHTLWTNRPPNTKRMLIALAGSPGSGKSTIGRHVTERMAKSSSGPSTMCISTDGYHLPLATLRALPNAEEALLRRGAPWTFDGKAIVQLVHRLRDDAGIKVVMAPSFDHAVKDPVQDDVTVPPDVQVCLLEGNYLLSNSAPWKDISDLVDDRWFVMVDEELARRRVAQRHLAAGIENSMDDALRRAENNDMVNRNYVLKHSSERYDVSVESIEETWYRG